MKKLGAWLGIISILWSNVAVAMLPQRGDLVIRGRNVTIVGAPPVQAIVQDISSVTYEDFDVTAFSLARFSMDTHRHIAEERKAQALRLDSSIPFIGGEHPKVDYKALRLLPFFIAEQLEDRVHPKIRSGALKFIEIIARNESALDPAIQIIPDIDCLYYKMVGDQQRLFLRLSSQTRQEAEVFKRASSGKTLFVESGDISLMADRSMTLDHVVAEADNVTCVAGQTIFNRASKMKAKWVIRLKAGKQRHETIINKWVRQERGKHHFTHAEGVESVDDCTFVARKVIQEGDDVENFGIFVEADEFEDLGIRTVNMPAKITLYNHAWAEDEDLFSSALSSVTKRDDVLVPTTYHVNYYKSLPTADGRETSVRFGYTIINSGSKIEVLKDIKEDVVVEEKHSIEIHEEKSGFSICGGVSVPDPTLQLQRMHSSYHSKNMMGLTTSAISAVAKGIRAYEGYKVAKELLTSTSPWNLNSTVAFLQTLSHYVNGPSVQFGSRSVDIMQEQILSHGNTFISPTQVFHNPRMSSFAGTYRGEDIDIKTKTFVTLALLQTSHSTMSVHQSGVSLDLLSFGIALMNPAIGSTMSAALAASSVNISFQDTETHQTVYLPTTMHASHSLKIEAENGRLTQAQIKAGLVHAIFTHDCLIETLASKKWSKSRGGELSMGLGAFAGDFKGMTDTLVDMAASANITHIDAGSFEKVIDDYASFVGEDEFYLEVGNTLRTKSAILGHATHDQSREHIEARERIDERVEEVSRSYDRSFDLSVGDFLKVGKFVDDLLGSKEKLRAKVIEQEIADGKTLEQAREIANEVDKVTDVAEIADGKVALKTKQSTLKLRQAVAEKSQKLAMQTFSMSDAEFWMFMSEYYQYHNDSITHEFLLQNVILERQRQQIYADAQRQFDTMSVSEQAKHYLSAAKNATFEYAGEYTNDPYGHTIDLALGTAYFAGDLITPGGLDAPSRFLRGESSFLQTALDQTESIGIEFISGTMVKKVFKYGKKGCVALVKGEKALQRAIIHKIAVKNGATDSLNPLVRLINGRKPINAEYAGKMFDMSKLPLEFQRKYPYGVHFTASGFPDFTRYATSRVKIQMTGIDWIDKSAADKVAGFIGGNKRPAGYTWHHHHDCQTMELIPTELNDLIKHSGGAALIRDAISKVGGIL